MGKKARVAMATGILLCAVPVPVLGPVMSAVPVASPRQSIALAEGWRFSFGADPAAQSPPPAASSAWTPVTVPHSWNRAGYYIPHPETHLNRPDNVNKDQGVGWYRLEFTAPAAARGRRAWLQFDAASRTAEVWLNGIRLGEHRGGFSRFRFDASAALHEGAANLLVVRTDNTAPAEGSSTADVLPIMGDFFVHGGLYRPVSLIVTDPVHFDMLDFGGPGIYATTTAIGGSGADVEVRARLRNDGRRSEESRLVAQLIDSTGRIAASSEVRLSMAADGATERVQRLHVPGAHLWQGTQDPYLYTLRVQLRAASGRLLDSLDQAFGIRQMRFDPAHGFFLNGRPYRLHGVGLHQDREGRGWARSAQDIAEDMVILRDMGANTIRLTHYQHGQTIHDLADRYGLILWDEVGLVAAWTYGNHDAASPELAANARLQLQELIRQNYNHPSVAVWGMANEVDFGSSRPDFLGGRPAVIPDPLPLLRVLNQLAHAEDSSRPTTLATCCELRGVTDAPTTAAATDLSGENRYFGWYYGRVGELGPHLDALHAARPEQPEAVTEYGAGGAITVHTDNPQGGPVDPGGRAQPEEYQSWVHEQSWPILDSKPYLWGTWLWTAFDFATTVRHEGDSNDINTKGLVTYDRATRKDAFYFYRANWSAAPTVHVTGRRYVDRAYPVADVRVYSNARSTELRVNGRALGAMRDCPQRTCVWRAVRLAPGANQIVASGGFASGVVRDAISWRLGDDAARNIRIDSGALVAAESQAGQFGSDDFFDGGIAGSVNRPGGRGRAPVVTPIAGTADQSLLASYREGAFRYRVPLEDGRYRVSLHFIEPSVAVGGRVFNVTANGTPQLRQFDIAAAAGAALTAVERSFEVSVNGGRLELGFEPLVGQPIVSAVEISRLDASSGH